MPFLQSSSVQIASVVTDDIVTIEIKDDELAGTEIHYEIADDKEHVCRKGHFTGLRVQMRIAHLKDGIYHLLLRSTENSKCRFLFHKTSGIYS